MDANYYPLPHILIKLNYMPINYSSFPFCNDNELAPLNGRVSVQVKCNFKRHIRTSCLIMSIV